MRKRLILVTLTLLLCLQLGWLCAQNSDENFFTGKKPFKSAVYSVVIPGAGQIYTEHYVKSAVFIAAEVYFFSSALYHNDQANKYYDKAQKSLGSNFEHYRILYNDSYNKRQSDLWWLGTTIFLSAIDAYVDAHLFNFEQKKQDLRLKFTDNKLTLSYSF